MKKVAEEAIDSARISLGLTRSMYSDECSTYTPTSWPHLYAYMKERQSFEAELFQEPNP